MKPSQTPDIQPDTRIATMRTELARAIVAATPLDGLNETAIPNLGLSRRTAATACASAAYMPELVIFVQGEKRVTAGRTTYICDATRFLLTSIDLPVVSQITVATEQHPMLALVLRLKMPLIRELLSQQEFDLDETSAPPISTRGMAVGTHTPELLDTCLRMVALLHQPQDIPYLGPLIQRELIYRLLRTPQGRHLRAIATLGELPHRTARAVEWLRINYAKPLHIDELAAIARMGVSTLHHQFRSLTAMSPLQYQKQLRLHVARERMLHNGVDAASAAFEVGYESPSQFSREYSRFFGQPPMRDIKALRSGGDIALDAA